MGGPPILLYPAHTKVAPEVLRASCFVFFFLYNISTLASHALGGMSIPAMLTELMTLFSAKACESSSGTVVLIKSESFRPWQSPRHPHRDTACRKDVLHGNRILF